MFDDCVENVSSGYSTSLVIDSCINCQRVNIEYLLEQIDQTITSDWIVLNTVGTPTQPKFRHFGEIDRRREGFRWRSMIVSLLVLERKKSSSS